MRSDYVIVGSGSAGAVLAARLSEDPATTVTLIEAGGRPKGKEVNIPVAFSKLFKGPFDWDYTTEPQDRLDGRRLYWPRGRALGGSSNINAQMWVRGHRADYDACKGHGLPMIYIGPEQLFGLMKPEEVRAALGRAFDK